MVHIHDPELLTLLPALRPFTPRLVYDMHEYVERRGEHQALHPAPRVRPAAAGLTAAAQRTLAALADGVVAVVPEQFDDLGERPRLRVAVPNYPRLERFAGAAPLPDMAADPRLKLIYIGSLTRNRGVPVMLDVMREVGDQAVLFLGGRFSNPEFEREVRELASGELAHCLRLLGPVRAAGRARPCWRAATWSGCRSWPPSSTGGRRCRASSSRAWRWASRCWPRTCRAGPRWSSARPAALW